MKRRNYYEILGVPYQADIKTIKKAYRALVKKYHPDGDKANQEMFHAIAEAYQVLTDPELRRQYHYMGHEAFANSFRKNSWFYQNRSGRKGAAASDPHGQNDFDGDGHCGACGHSHDGTGHGSGNHGGSSGQGEDGHCGACEQGRKKASVNDEEIPPSSIRAAVHLTMEETLKEVLKDVTITYDTVCPHCQGSGCEPGTEKETCPDCFGQGSRLSFTHDMREEEQVCRTCGGLGQVPKQPCSRCRGQKTIQIKRLVKVKLPSGSYPRKFFVLDDVVCDDSFQQKLPHYILVVLVDDHPQFTAQDYHLYAKLTVSFTRLALGGTLWVPTIEGPHPFQLSPGTPSGSKIRLPGQGLPVPKKNGGGRGDLYITLNVEIPKNLTAQQEELLRMLEESFQGEEATAL